jgi:hypothetical protein
VRENRIHIPLGLFCGASSDFEGFEMHSCIAKSSTKAKGTHIIKKKMIRMEKQRLVEVQYKKVFV